MNHKNLLKTNLIFLTAAVIMTTLMAVGCGQTGSTPAPNYFPHENGYRWVYKTQLNIGTVESWRLDQTCHVGGTSQLTGGLTVINFVMSVEASSPITYYYYTDATGVYNYGNSSHPTTEADQILAFPLEAGKVWTRNASEPLLSEAIGIEDVTVPAGTFRAMKVTIGNGDFYEWYADGVGLVKTLINLVVTTLEAGKVIVAEGTFVRELKSKNF
jgi:hypothetical protein